MQTNKLTKGDIVFCRSVTFAAFYTPDRFLKPVRCGVTAPTIFVFHFLRPFYPRQGSEPCRGKYGTVKYPTTVQSVLLQLSGRACI